MSRDFLSLPVTSLPVVHAHSTTSCSTTSQHHLKYDFVRTHILLRSFPHSEFITGFVTSATRVEHLRSPRFFFTCLSGVRVCHVVKLHQVLVPCFNVRYDFQLKTIIDLLFALHRVPVLFMLFVFIYVYWCPNLFPYQIMSVLLNNPRRFSHMEQELPTLPEHLSAP